MLKYVMLVFFSDEKKFDQNQKFKRRNDNGLSQILLMISERCTLNFQLANDVSHISPLVFPQVLELNANGYIETIQTVVKHRMNEICSKRPYIFQQDSTLQRPM